MTKKHYIQIARAISETVKRDDNHPDRTAHFYAARQIADSLCSVFRQDNSRFDRERFLTACGLKEAA